jgi:FKBP-type peptidyl-prolyl cis-trans isomerase FkpA
MLIPFAKRGRAVVLAIVLMVSIGAAAGCSDNPLNPSDFGVTVTDLVVGTGTEARTGRGVTVHYTLWLYDEAQPEGKGTLIETSIGGQPLSRALGYNQVIGGWEVGLPGMRVGGTRRLIVPPSQAYGSSQVGNIPGNSTLVFDVQLLGVY